MWKLIKTVSRYFKKSNNVVLIVDAKTTSFLLLFTELDLHVG